MYLAERARAFDNLFANSITFPGVTPHPFVVIGSYSSSISRNRRRTFVTGSGVEAAVAIFSDTVLVSSRGLVAHLNNVFCPLSKFSVSLDFDHSACDQKAQLKHVSESGCNKN